MKTTFTQDWKDWITLNVNNGQNKDGLFKILLDEGYDFVAISKEMKYLPSVPVEQLINPFHVAKQHVLQTQAQTQTQVKQANNGVAIDTSQLFIPNAKKLPNNKIELYTLANFLNAEECEKIIALITSKLRPSELSSYDADTAFRTSRTCDLGTLNDDFMADIDNRICRMMGIDASYSEVVQGQYYEVGQQFKAHTDYFETHEIAKYGGKMGQRTYTMMIYLNDVEAGGETAFVNIGEIFTPKQGMAVIWNSLLPDGTPNVDTMHFAKPIIKGYKAVITKWFRSNSQLPQTPPMWTKEANEYVSNYTKLGFKKSTLPTELFKKITHFYQQNKTQMVDEYVPGDFIVSADKKSQSSVLVELPTALRSEIHDSLKPILENWCGKTLNPTYVYGIRVYQNQAQLKSHRDRIETHLISVIINVDQDVNEDWPLVIEDNYYRTHHVMLKPGEVIFYEGARLTHGRPIALNGNSFANIFCHFIPTDYIAKFIK